MARKKTKTRPKKPKTTPTEVYQIKVTLNDSKPPIWRRVQVAADITLAKLHDVMQVAMGWHNCHLHQFTDGEQYYGEPDPQWDMDVINERKVKLNEVLARPKSRFTYEYDFGDGWNHSLLLEKVLPGEPGQHYPMCVTGKRACPPEDCGGMWGYYEMLEVIADPSHEEHEEMLEWLGEGFDPEAFDLESVNKYLARFS